MIRWASTVIRDTRVLWYIKKKKKKMSRWILLPTWAALFESRLIMVIELSGVQFGLKSYAWFQNHKYNFGPKLHNTKFNYHFITPTQLKSHSFIVNINLLFLWYYISILMGSKKDVIYSKKYCDLGINRTVESRSDCKDHQWFQNGCNKYYNLWLKVNRSSHLTLQKVVLKPR